MTFDQSNACTAPAQFFAPEALGMLVEQETRLRIDCKRSPAAHGEAARQVLRGAAALVELVYLSLIFVEVARSRGATTLKDTVECATEVSATMHSLTGLRTEDVFADNAQFVQHVARLPTPGPDHPIPDIPTIVTLACTIEKGFPCTELVELAARMEVPEYGARVQVALDGLRRFIKRNDPWVDRRMHTVGPDYAAGKLGLEDVAAVLELNIPDAVARLEEYGYARPLEHFTLTESRRDELYEALRTGRLGRAGTPSPSPVRIMRDVIASQRIEDVDARRWLDPKLM